MNLLSQMTSTPIDFLFKVRHQDIFEGKDMRTLSHLSVSVKVQGRFISVLSGRVTGNSACHSWRVLYGYHAQCTVAVRPQNFCPSFKASSVKLLPGT